MPADLVAIAILVVVLATLAAPLAADCRRRLATRRFDAVYERNLLRRTGRGQFGAPAAGPGTGRGQSAAPARAGSVTRTAMTSPAGGVRRPRADRRSRASSTARV
jgi:hypothetical protein